MTVLVAYASMSGSTAEIAEWIGGELRSAGLAAHVRPAAEVDGVDAYEAVVLGGAVYMAGWHTDAMRFAHRFADALLGRPVWVFSSGPLDHSADDADVPPLPPVATAVGALRARGHATFGGRITVDSHGWLGVLGRRMTEEGHGGDFRNPERVRAWARMVAADIAGAQCSHPIA